jgi:hypothetical protein
VMAASSTRGLSAGVALFATGDQFYERLLWLGQFLGLQNHLRIVVADQPLAQLAFDGFPVRDAEFRTSMRPPGRNAFEANELAAMEQSARVGPLEKAAAPGTRLDAEQRQAVFDMLQAALKGGQSFIWGVLGVVGQRSPPDAIIRPARRQWPGSMTA